MWLPVRPRVLALVVLTALGPGLECRAAAPHGTGGIEPGRHPLSRRLGAGRPRDSVCVVPFPSALPAWQPIRRAGRFRGGRGQAGGPDASGCLRDRRRCRGLVRPCAHPKFFVIVKAERALVRVLRANPAPQAKGKPVRRSAQAEASLVVTRFLLAAALQDRRTGCAMFPAFFLCQRGRRFEGTAQFNLVASPWRIRRSRPSSRTSAASVATSSWHGPGARS